MDVVSYQIFLDSIHKVYIKIRSPPRVGNQNYAMAISLCLPLAISSCASDNYLYYYSLPRCSCTSNPLNDGGTHHQFAIPVGPNCTRACVDSGILFPWLHTHLSPRPTIHGNQLGSAHSSAVPLRGSGLRMEARLWTPMGLDPIPSQYVRSFFVRVPSEIDSYS